MSDYSEHLISMAGGDGDPLDHIQRRVDKLAFSALSPAERDRRFLLATVRDQAAKLGRVAVLAEEWRYKGENGWGAWQEGEGPDPEGYLLDCAAGEVRAALTATEASK